MMSPAYSIEFVLYHSRLLPFIARAIAQAQVDRLSNPTQTCTPRTLFNFSTLAGPHAKGCFDMVIQAFYMLVLVLVLATNCSPPLFSLLFSSFFARIK